MPRGLVPLAFSLLKCHAHSTLKCHALPTLKCHALPTLKCRALSILKFHVFLHSLFLDFSFNQQFQCFQLQQQVSASADPVSSGRRTDLKKNEEKTRSREPLGRNRTQLKVGMSGTATPETKVEENADGCALREKTRKLSCEERKNGNGRTKKNSVI